MNVPPPFRNPHGLVVLNCLTLLDPLEEASDFLLSVRWHQKENRLPYNFRGGVAVKPLRTGIPALNNTLDGLAQDGVIRGFHDGGKVGTRRFHPLVLRAAADHSVTADATGRSSFRSLF